MGQYKGGKRHTILIKIFCQLHSKVCPYFVFAVIIVPLKSLITNNVVIISEKEWGGGYEKAMKYDLNMYVWTFNC